MYSKRNYKDDIKEIDLNKHFLFVSGPEWDDPEHRRQEDHLAGQQQVYLAVTRIEECLFSSGSWIRSHI